MKIEEFYNYTRLFDVYGKLLSNKQFEVMDKFLNLDIGESELAELVGESRQSIHDAITKAKKQLISFENKCGVLNTFEESKIKLLQAKAFLLIDSQKSADLLDDVIKNI